MAHPDLVILSMHTAGCNAEPFVLNGTSINSYSSAQHTTMHMPNIYCVNSE